MFYNTAIAMFPNDRITNWRGTPSIKKQVVSPSQRNDLHYVSNILYLLFKTFRSLQLR